eukprot:2264100-Amphidinium_carterae.1
MRTCVKTKETNDGLVSAVDMKRPTKMVRPDAIDTEHAINHTCDPDSNISLTCSASHEGTTHARARHLFLN